MALSSLRSLLSLLPESHSMHRDRQHPIPRGLDVGDGSQEGEADPRGALQESGLVSPAEVVDSLPDRAPGAEASHAPARQPQVQGALEPEAGSLREALLAGGLVHAVEEMGQ